MRCKKQQIQVREFAILRGKPEFYDLCIGLGVNDVGDVVMRMSEAMLDIPAIYQYEYLT